ncbi:MAG: hypothetical protein IIB63_04810 [Proteobacteria bacterium]|nr:hypothetical protein [Pseudomonadota bacterium]
MDLLEAVLQRSVIITLAIAGAAVAMVGTALLRKGSRVDPRIGRFVLRTGYAMAWGSVVVFITAGFLGY